jgi:hypothetical protein
MNHPMTPPLGRRLWRGAAALAFGALMLFGTTAFADEIKTRGDIVQFGGDVEVPADVAVHGDVVVFGGDCKIHGQVSGNAIVFGGDLRIYPEGSVHGSTVAFGGNIDNESSATPSKTHGIPAPSMAPMPVIPETPIMPEIPQAPEVSIAHHNHFGVVWASIVVPDLLLTLLAFFLFPLRVRNVEEHLAAQPLLAVALGFVAPILLAVVLIVLAVLVVTIPLIPVALIAYFLAYLIGKAAIAGFLGRRLLEAAKVADPQPLAQIVVGLFVLLIVTGPTPAWFAITMFSVVGALATGAAIVSFGRSRPGRVVGWTVQGTVQAAPPSYTPPAGPAASGPPAIPQ